MNAGEITIDINHGARRITPAKGESLFAALKKEGIFLPSVCGGQGLCGRCRLKLLAGGGALTDAEKRLLSTKETDNQIRLGCQIVPTGDAAIEIPQELLKIRNFRGVVERIRDLTYDIKELRIRLIEPESIEFVPGQYVQLDTPPYGSIRQGVSRAYSISSPPSDSGNIELIIRKVPGGISTTWVFERLKEGSEVTFSGPYGEFHLSETDLPMCWIAGGSGMAPFWSLLRHMKEAGIPRTTKYFFGAVQKRDLFLVDELEHLSRTLPWFEFIPALSGDEPPEVWSGQRGLITDVVERNIEDGNDWEGYLCGSPGMIDAAVKVLKYKGIREDRVFFDKFA